MKILPPLKPPINVRSLAVNTVAMWAETITSILVLLWLTRMLMETFGLEQFGLWREALALVTVIVTLDLGQQIASHRFLANQLVAKRRGGLYRHFSSSMAISLVLTIVLTAAMFGAGFFLPDFQHVPENQHALYTQMIWILAACISFMVLRFPVQSVVLGMQVGYKLAMARTIGQLVFVGLATAFIHFGWLDLRLIAMSLSASYLVTLVIVCFQARKCLGALSFSFRHVRRAEVLPMLRFGAGTFLIPISAMLLYQFDPLIIGTLIDERAVAFFAPASMIVLPIRSLMTGVGAPLLSVAAQLSAGGKHELLAELYHSAARLTGALTACFLLPLAIFGESFLKYWTGKADFAWTWQILAVLSLGQLVALTSLPGERMLIGSGRFRLAAWSSLFAGLVKISLGVAALAAWPIMGQAWSLIGLAWATTLPLLILQGVIFPMAFCRQIGVPLGRYTASTLGRIILSALPVAAALLVLRHYWEPCGFIETVAQLTAGFVLMSAVAWFVTFTPKDRTYILSMIRPK